MEVRYKGQVLIVPDGTNVDDVCDARCMTCNAWFVRISKSACHCASCCMAEDDQLLADRDMGD